MAWNEPRSRDAWLAEVKRRGGRMRRRRQLATAVVGALAIVLPVSAVTTLLGGDADRSTQELSVAGPALGGRAAPEAGIDGPSQPAAVEDPAPTTTIAEPQLRVETGPARTEPGFPLPTLPSPALQDASPRADDPVVRPPTTVPDSANSSSPAQSPAPATTVAPAEPALAPCPTSEVGVAVTTSSTSYAPGQTVQGSSTLENRGPAACLLPTRAFFKVLDAAGKDVGTFAYTADFRYPVKAEPGRTFTSAFSWDQRDCTGSACVQASPGTYTAVAEWTESGPYSASTTFRIAG